MPKKSWQEQKLLSQNPTVYIGPSMNPTLKAPDILKIVPYADFSQIKVGDVIVFDSPKEKISITHRVIKVNPECVITRGDNNLKIDPWELSSHDIAGKVCSAKRGKKNIIVWGGQAGLYFHLFLRVKFLVSRLLRNTFSPIYRTLANINLFPKLFPKALSPRLLTFRHSHFSERQLVLGKWVVGRKLGQKKWKIRFPFRLIVDLRKLP